MADSLAMQGMALMFGENRPWWLLGALSGVLGLTVLGETVVGVALPFASIPARRAAST